MPAIDTARAWYPATDLVHGFDHVLRVYRLAERLALAEGADLQVVRAAVLLHDAQPGHPASAAPAEGAGDFQAAGDRESHHLASAGFARQVLAAEGWEAEKIAAVQHCIRAHRFRDAAEQPQTLEAQILFDADKLDAIGATGVARAIAYAVLAGQPAYAPPSGHFLASGCTEPGEPHSAYHEYLFKLSKLKDRLFTPSGRRLAEARHRLMSELFAALQDEMSGAA